MADEHQKPRSFVTEAHARGLLTFFDIAKLLDLEPLDVLHLMWDGQIDHEHIDNKPCASLAALDAYRRRQVA